MTTPVRELSGKDFCDMQPHLASSHVIKGLIQPNSLVLILGASGAGKTFAATDLACHTAAGMSWRGHRVRRGLVAYAQLEGAISGENRFAAWRHKYLAPKQSIPLRMTPGPINLRDAADVEALIAFVRTAEEHHEEKCALVFVDTLSRAMAGGDENASEDMTALIAGADSVRAATQAAVVLVHHHGKDEARGARGHSSLKAAADTQIEVAIDGESHVITVTKQRDLASGAKYAFTLEVVELGRDEDDDPVTSCVVVPTDDVPNRKALPSGKNQQALLAAVQEWHRTHHIDVLSGQELRAIASAQKLDRKRLGEAIAGLQRLGWLQPSGSGLRYVPEEAP